jgi:hypothetical protein
LLPNVWASSRLDVVDVCQKRVKTAHLVIELIVRDDRGKTVVDVPQMLKQRIALLVLVYEDGVAMSD